VCRSPYWETPRREPRPDRFGWSDGDITNPDGTLLADEEAAR
jgi:hypothetical protein